MTDPLLDFWQKEAARFETGVHVNMTRTYALIGAGLTGLATVFVGLFVTKRVELVLVIPFIVLLIWIIALVTSQEVLVKALYQYRAERMIKQLLPGSPEDAYFTWEDVGGRLGHETRTTAVFWVTVALLSFLLAVGSILYFLGQTNAGDLQAKLLVYPFGVQWMWAVGAAFIAMFAGIVVSLSLMISRYRLIKSRFGYDRDLTVSDVLDNPPAVALVRDELDGAEAAVSRPSGKRHPSSLNERTLAREQRRTRQ